MNAAMALYRRFGFAEIPAYCYNPVPGTRYFARRVGASTERASDGLQSP